MSAVSRTPREIAHALFTAMADPSAEGTERSTLVAIVLDLLVEVEALREAVIRLGSESSEPSSRDAYRDAYQRAALLSHSSAGMSSGVEKILSRYYGEKPEVSDEGATWREALMLRRLGATEGEIAAFVAEARRARRFT